MKIAVLGAGLLGSCLAAELARLGFEVDLYDREKECITQAGLRNEGKIHLGFVYGADPSFETSQIMLEGSLKFTSLLRRWLGSKVESISLSSPFYYAVTHDSQLSIEQVESHFYKIESEINKEKPVDYLGLTHLEPVKRLTDKELALHFNCGYVSAAFSTPERAVNVHCVASLLRDHIECSDKINFYPECYLMSVDTKEGNCITYEHNGVIYEKPYEYVVNALWDGRLAIDKTAGMPVVDDWCFRLKEAVHIKTNSLKNIKSTTVIQGPYGDIVNFGNGHFYLSWYPVCLRNFNRDLNPIQEELNEHQALLLKHETIKSLSNYHPALSQLSVDEIDWQIKGGIIFAKGDTDISDPKSKLHTRSAIGIKSKGNYYSVDPGKYCLCPYYALKVADKICLAESKISSLESFQLVH